MSEFRTYILGTYIRRYLIVHITRRDYADTTVSSFKLLARVCQLLYGSVGSAGATSHFQLFQDDMRVVFLPVIECLLRCDDVGSPVHLRIRASSLEFFSALLDSLLQFELLQKDHQNGEEWTELSEVLVDRILAETVMAQAQIHSRPQLLKLLPSQANLEDVRNRFPYDSLDYATFCQQFPLSRGVRVSQYPEQLQEQQAEVLKKVMLGNTLEIWVRLFSYQRLSLSSSLVLHHALNEVVLIASRYYPAHHFVLSLKSGLLRLGKKGECLLALLDSPSDRSLSDCLV